MDSLDLPVQLLAGPGFSLKAMYTLVQITMKGQARCLPVSRGRQRRLSGAAGPAEQRAAKAVGGKVQDAQKDKNGRGRHMGELKRRLPLTLWRLGAESNQSRNGLDQDGPLPNYHSNYGNSD